MQQEAKVTWLINELISILTLFHQRPRLLNGKPNGRVCGFGVLGSNIPSGRKVLEGVLTCFSPDNQT